MRELYQMQSVGQHRVILMNEQDIQTEVAKCSQDGKVPVQGFVGQSLLAPKMTISHHGVR